MRFKAHIAQSVEHFLGKEEVTSSNLVMSSMSMRDTGHTSLIMRHKTKSCDFLFCSICTGFAVENAGTTQCQIPVWEGGRFYC